MSGRTRRRRRALIAFLIIIAVLVGAYFGAIGWYHRQLSAAPGSHTQKVLEIPRGLSTGQIAAKLEDSSIIRNARVFTWYTRFTNAGPFEAGRYRFVTNASADEAIDVFTRGPLGPEITTVSIPEGFRLTQIVDRIHQRVPRLTVSSLEKALTSGAIQSDLLVQGNKNYEGVLFPATYDVTPDDSALDVLQMMADAMNRRVRSISPDPKIASLHLSQYQLVTVASLVQAEAGNPDEAPKISRVIYNRLATDQPLGIDATSRYLSIMTGDDVDFESSSPFNTRRQRGLPPTPIGAPGEFALNAAFHPADGPWIYYVRDVHNDSQDRPQHVFTDSPEVFARAKQACYEAGLGCGPS